MVEENIIEQDGQVGTGEQDVEEADHGGQQVSPPPVFPVQLVEMFALEKYDGEEPDHGDLIIIIIRTGQIPQLQPTWEQMKLRRSLTSWE